MSYSFATQNIERGNDISSAIDEAYHALSENGQVQNGTASEARYAVDRAASAAVHIAAGLGPNWKTIKISVVGHANVGNVKTPGWADEFCQVKVDVVEYQ